MVGDKKGHQMCALMQKVMIIRSLLWGHPFFPLKGHPVRHFTMFCPQKGQPRGHFITFFPTGRATKGALYYVSPLERHPRGHFCCVFSNMGQGASSWCYIIMQESYISNLLAYGPLIVTASNLPHRHIYIDTLLGWGCPHRPCSRSFINHSAASDECVLPPLQTMTSCSHQHLIEWLHLFVSSVLLWMEPQTITGSVTIQSDLSDLPLCYTDFWRITTVQARIMSSASLKNNFHS